MEPTRLDTFLGMNNLLPAEKLQMKDGAFVQDAVNGDFTAAGTYRRRDGMTLSLPAPGAHSLTSHGNLYAAGNSMYRLKRSSAGVLENEEVASGLTPNLPFSYANTPAGVYASNGREFFRIPAVGAAVPVGLESPDEVAAHPVVTGALPAGVYLLAVSFRGADGRDSGLGPAVAVTLDVTGGIQIDFAPSLPGADTVLYMSGTNGDVLFERQVIAGAAAISSLPEEGGRAVAMLTAPLPAGTSLTYCLGRLFSANGNAIHYSEEYALELCDLGTNYFLFPEPVRMIVACINGLYISADATYWLDARTFDLKRVANHRAVAGSASEARADVGVFWMSDRGLVKGTPEGVVESLQEGVLAMSPAQFGASIVREENGERQVVVSTFGNESTVLTSRAWMDAEVIRKEERA